MTFIQTDGDDVIGIRADEQGTALSCVDKFGQQIEKLRKAQIVFHLTIRYTADFELSVENEPGYIQDL